MSTAHGAPLPPPPVVGHARRREHCATRPSRTASNRPRLRCRVAPTDRLRRTRVGGEPVRVRLVRIGGVGRRGESLGFRHRLPPRSLRMPDTSAKKSSTAPSIAIESQRRFDDLVSSLDAIVWEADGDDYRMTFLSPRAAEITGYSIDDWLHEPSFWERHLHPEDCERAISVTDAAIKALNSVRIEYRFRIASGEYRWFSDVIRVIRKPDGSGHRLVGVMIDITEQKRIEEALAYRAAHDTLTGLLNREQLDIELARVHQRPEPWALLFLDLDGFKDVNDALG